MRTLSVALSLALGAGLAAIAPLAACGASVQTPGSGRADDIPANYPPTIVDSKEHRETMTAEWTRLFDSYAIPPERRTVPELEPVTHTPKSILGSGPIPLVAAGSTAPLDEERVRLLLRNFVAERAQLLGVTAPNLSLSVVGDAGNGAKRYTYVQSDYPHPIVEPYGRVEIVASPAGEILQLSDTAVPVADLPAEARIARDAAAKMVLGSTFTYSDFAGKQQQQTVTDPTAVVVHRLVVYPELVGEALRMHLAWEVEAGSGMTWTVFVDAITGDKIGTRQNFQT